MSAFAEIQIAQRHILLVGPYGVLGTGVIDAVAENPKWGITTAARRPPPTYRAHPAPPHISADLMDREGTAKAFSSLDRVTDLVFAADVEKPTMAETVEPNARMLKNTLDALAARNVPPAHRACRRCQVVRLQGWGVQRSSEGDRATSHCADPLPPAGRYCG
jgi:hypothetical protein